MHRQKFSTKNRKISSWIASKKKASLLFFYSILNCCYRFRTMSKNYTNELTVHLNYTFQALMRDKQGRNNKKNRLTDRKTGKNTVQKIAR